MKHDYSTYANGLCRCKVCRAANTAYKVARMHVRRQEMDAGKVYPIHGTKSTYDNYRCRCEFCRAAAAAYARSRVKA